MVPTTQFCIDFEDGPCDVFSGVTDGRTWNGWEMPVFPFDEMQRLAARYNEGLEIPHFWYDADRDAFVWVEADEDAGDAGNQTIIEAVVTGGGSKFYNMAGAGWTWMRHTPAHEITGGGQ